MRECDEVMNDSSVVSGHAWQDNMYMHVYDMFNKRAKPFACLMLASCMYARQVLPDCVYACNHGPIPCVHPSGNA